MKVSTKGRYALRLMMDLALHSTDGPVSLRDVAGRQEISEKYLEQIISVLNKAGYVKSVRGPQGGYLLTRAPEEYTVGMILRQTEGSLAPVACVEEKDFPCERQEDCVTILLWKKIRDAIDSVVDNTTLQDLLDWQSEKNGQYII
ncbi:MAG: Rrf2 family transcriptional regulator [Blautia sp.]|nr:Rrf2 family transcriptional regulator [Blautia sp.]